MTKRRRSEDWLNNPAEPDQTAIYVERYQNYGITRKELQSGKPIVGIVQSGSDLTPCNRHHIELAKRIRDGIRDAGGIAMEFPMMPIAEQGRRPTAALDRNLAFLSLVELLHGYPLDGVVLTTGCDKTTPAALMAVAAVNIPSIVFSGGPMLNGWQGEKRIGSGTIVWQSREQYARGEIDYEGFMDNLNSSAPSIGHCNTMGTALSMNAMAEALGMSLNGCAAIPAPHQARAEMAYESGTAIVEIINEERKPADVMTKAAFINAIKVVSAIGGSSNVPPHMLAIAKYLGVDLGLQDWQDHGESMPLLVNCQPAGEYLGEDFFRAGGVPAVMAELDQAGLLNTDLVTVDGSTIAERIKDQRSQNQKVIMPLTKPMLENAGFAVMKSNFFSSALMKKSVIAPAFREKYLSDPDSPNRFRCQAVVFDSAEDYHQRINDDALNINENSMLVIRNCGPVGYPGSAEVVNMLPPRRLVEQGITELPCLGDGRQSGTSASPSILNVSPEAAIGGGLALVNTGDWISVDLNTNTVTLEASEAELAEREQRRQPIELVNQTPWQEIYRDHVGQLETGATLELRETHRDIINKHGTPRHSH